MAVSKLPSGRWRVQLYVDGRLVSVAKIMGGETTFANERLARRAESAAYEFLEQDKARGVTVSEWRETWLSDPLYRRPKESTMIHNRERTKAFVERYGGLALAQVDDRVVAEWIAGGRNLSTVPVLKAMFNDAASATAGRIVSVNPFAGLRLKKGRGRADLVPGVDIPTEERVWEVIRAARRVSCPDFAAWLQVAAFTGMRPGELDGLRRSNVDLEAGVIRVVEQFSAKSRTFTLPKNGKVRDAVLTEQAREAIMSLPEHPSGFAFVNLRGNHWTASARAYHWKAVRAASGYTGDFYEAGRHFAGWYMVNVLELDSEIVAIALGHEDGGLLVRTLYGHRDKKRALDRVRDAYARQSNVVPLRAVKDDPA